METLVKIPEETLSFNWGDGFNPLREVDLPGYIVLQ
jgi:hypothetical protein